MRRGAPLRPHGPGRRPRHPRQSSLDATVAIVVDNLAASAVGVGSATATLSDTENLAASAVGVGAATASLTVTHNLAAAAVGVGSATAALAEVHHLTAAAVGVGAGVAALTTTAAPAVATRDVADVSFAEVQVGPATIPAGGFDRYLEVVRLETAGRVRAEYDAELHPLLDILLAANEISADEWVMLRAA